MKVTISERGNGFPGAGDYVPGDDGELYLILRMGRNILTGQARYGVANSVPGCEVVLADWDDCDEDEIFPASAIC